MVRGLRSDAVRNRARILQAAREQIALVGPDVGMDVIAESAGVAVGTLYRHFPSKADLVAAVMVELMDRLAVEAEHSADRVAEGAPAGDELIAFIRGVVDAFATNHAAKVAAVSLGGDAANDEAVRRAEDAVVVILSAAQRAGAVRPDLTVSDIYLIVSTAPYEQPAAARERWLDLVLAGLTDPAARS